MAAAERTVAGPVAAGVGACLMGTWPPSGSGSGLGLLLTSNVAVNPFDTFTKTSGPSVFSGGFTSAQSFADDVGVSWQVGPPNGTSDVIVGLATNPLNTDVSMSYGIYPFNDGSGGSIYENGVSVQVLPAAAIATTTYRVEYDGTNVKYYQNNVLLRTTPRAVGLPLFVTSTFFQNGAFIKGLVWGQLPATLVLPTVREGINARMGTAVLVAGTVVVTNAIVTANSRIFLSCQNLAGAAVPQAVSVTARTAGTSFTLTSASAIDTSTVAWEIIEPG
jgi:hypothetical protein